MLSPNGVALTLLAVAVFLRPLPVFSEPSLPGGDAIAARLKTAYPDFVAGIMGNDVIFKDGTRLPFDDGREKTFEQWLEAPDIEDMFKLAYPRGAAAAQPALDFDPGRARNAAFFSKLYGDCAKPGFSRSLTTVAWLPGRSKQKLQVTSINGVADKLRAVSGELDALPSRFAAFLVPAAGAFVCRVIAGTDRNSAHGYGIAIDIALRHSHYWRWGARGSEAALHYRNQIPAEIVDIFEKHGFIWGGRWYHYDTMHFEYRPELLGPEK